jgi:hypothetical protein
MDNSRLGMKKIKPLEQNPQKGFQNIRWYANISEVPAQEPYRFSERFKDQTNVGPELTLYFKGILNKPNVSYPFVIRDEGRNFL